MEAKKPRLSPHKLEILRKEYPTGNLEELREKLGLSSVTSLYSFASLFKIDRDKSLHYKNLSDSCIELHKKERRRVRWGLPQKTGWHIMPPLSHAEHQCRMRLRRMGYIVGDYRTHGERKTIYYTSDMERHKRAEKFAKKLGFRLEKLSK